MKRFISVPDIENKSIIHLFEMPSALFIHAKACDDGVAMVIGDNITGQLRGFTLPVKQQLLPFYTELIARGESGVIESSMAGELLMAIEDFLNTENPILEIGDNHCQSMYLSELNLFLQEWKDEEDAAKRNRNNHKKK